MLFLFFCLSCGAAASSAEHKVQAASPAPLAGSNPGTPGRLLLAGLAVIVNQREAEAATDHSLLARNSPVVAGGWG